MIERRLVSIAGGLLFAATAVAQHGESPYWGPEMQITDDGLNASGAVGRKLAIDQAGYFHVVYHTVDEWKVFYTRSEDGGATWTDPIQISTGTLPASGPVIATGQPGWLHVCWNNRDESGDKRIYYARFIPGTGWETPRDISGALALDSEGPSLVVDTNNRVHVAWHIGDPSIDVYPPSEAARVYYTRSTDGGDTIESPRQLSTETGYHAAWPRLSMKGANGDLLAFAYRDHRAFPDWDVYALVSTDGGETFAEHAVAATAGKEWDPEAAVDPLGIIHVTYSMNPGPSSSVHYRRSVDDGATWSDETTLSDYRGIFSSFSYSPITSTLWVWWKDERDAEGGDRKSDIITRYSLSGGLVWSDAEFVTDLGDLDSRFPSMAVDPAGRPVVQWADLRNGADMSTMLLKQRTVAPCPGDIDGNGSVDVPDLLAVLAAWGQSGVPEDVNADGTVDVLDLLAVLAEWGPCA
jgi:hypothetical protein